MRILRSVASMGLMCGVGLAWADGGLNVGVAGGFYAGTSLHVHALQLDTSTPRLGYQAASGLYAYMPFAASVSGDYYFSSYLGDPALPRTGFRASSALLIRQPGVSLSDLTLSARSTAKYGLPLQHSLALSGADGAGSSLSTTPYLGIGYSDYSLKSGWGFWADIGLVVQSPGNALGVGRVLSGTQGVEELMRELRMAPMVQFGVNYSF